MNTTARRVLRRHLYGSIFRTLENVPLILGDSGIVSESDVRRLLALSEIHVDGLRFSHPDYLPKNYLRWQATDEDGKPVEGELRFHLATSKQKAMVSAEIVLMTIDPSRVTRHRVNTESDPDVDSVLRLVARISRQAIADLRQNPTDVKPIIQGLVDIVDLVEALHWFDECPIRD